MKVIDWTYSSVFSFSMSLKPNETGWLPGKLHPLNNQLVRAQWRVDEHTLCGLICTISSLLPCRTEQHPWVVIHQEYLGLQSDFLQFPVDSSSTLLFISFSAFLTINLQETVENRTSSVKDERWFRVLHRLEVQVNVNTGFAGYSPSAPSLHSPSLFCCLIQCSRGKV